MKVFSQDKSIYEAVENAFITIYLRKNPAETAKNLLNLSIDSNIGDQAALEFIVDALVSKGDISTSVVCFLSYSFHFLSLVNFYLKFFPFNLKNIEKLNSSMTPGVIIRYE